MVNAGRRISAPFHRRVVVALMSGALVLLALALAAVPARAAESVETQPYEIQETYTISLNAVGDAHFTDVLKYDAAFFAEAVPYLKQYPELLSRRYERQAAVRELQNFSSQLDEANATVTLSFDESGYAWNEGDHWQVPFLYSAPTRAEDGVQVFEETSTVNNEFTLFEDATYMTVTRVELPTGAQGTQWDQQEDAVRYTLAYEPPPPPGNVLQRHSTAFAVLFAVLMAGSLGAAALLLLRKPGSPAAVEEPARPPQADGQHPPS